MMKTSKLIIFLLVVLLSAQAQMKAQSDSTGLLRTDTVIGKGNPYKFRIRQVILPTVLIGVGIIGLESDWLKYQNREMRDELQENIDRHFTMDDFTQYVPMAAVYGLNLCGIKGKHSFADRTIILGTAYALMGISVNSLKRITKVERPDGSLSLIHI